MFLPLFLKFKKLRMDDFIEDSYLDPTAENGSHNASQNASISAQSPSSFFTIDSDSDNGIDLVLLKFFKK